MSKNHAEAFINKAIEKHQNKYDYSKVDYVNSKTKVIIICPEHGEFEQLTGNHLKGQIGCKECRGKSKNFISINTFNDFLILAKEKHGNKYNYDKSEFKGSREKIKIICPIHGEFWQLPYAHIQYQCPNCSSNHNLKYSTETFIEECNKIHNNKYQYDKCIYTGILNDIIITCPIHGDFITSATNHISGSNCLECQRESYRLGKDEFIKRSKEIHGNTFDYSKVVYINIFTKVIINCPAHGDFEQTPVVHLKGCGCKICSRENKIPSKGEYLIKEWLKENNISFKYQFELITDKIARGSNIMIVDFFVKYKGQQYFIEYDGKQHFEYIPFFFPAYEDFEKQQRRDKVLNEFCELHKDKVTLIRFKYNESNEEIIKKLIKIFN